MGNAKLEDLKIDAPSPKAQRKRRWPILIAVLALPVLGVVGWRLVVGSTAESSPVEVYAVPSTAAQSTAGGFTAGGYLEVIPPGPLVVSTTVDARVKHLAAIPGQTVRQGELLATLDDTILKQELVVLDAATEAARARLEAAEVELERTKRLLEIGAAAQKHLDAAHAAHRAAGAELTGLEAERARSAWKVSQCELRAPADGAILDVFAQPGQWLSPADQGEKPGGLLSLFDPEQIQAWVDVNQRDIGGVFVGQQVTLATDADPTGHIAGRVSRILPKANLQKNTVQAKVEILEPTPSLRPEMSVKVTFLARGAEPASSQGVRIPETAILEDARGVCVYVLQDGRAKRRTVEVKERASGFVLVDAGVLPGDRVLLNPQGIRDGDPLTVRELENL